MKTLALLGGIVALAGAAYGAGLQARSEFIRTDPFGTVIETDKRGAEALTITNARGAVSVEGARGGYVSFQLVANVPEGGRYSLAFEFAKPGKLQADLFREWFHLTPPDKRYYPDGLIPVPAKYQSQMPEPDNRVEKQTAQPFWVDVWIPADAAPGAYQARAVLQAAGKTFRVPVEIKVLPAVVPEKDAIAIDHNSYGTSFLADYFRRVRDRNGDKFFQSDDFFKLIHSYYRLVYEHRGVFHNLGYGHAGKVGPEFAPVLEGSGRNKHIADWTLYDRHFGPLFDGSAFANTRRGAQPIPYVYLPINPEWPAQYLSWGEPGYEAEFVNVVSEMEKHFREKGWTKTVFEVFFNHKKRYRGFEWDGDETRFPHDYQYFAEYDKLLKKALPSDTPVQFRMRSDVSWAMEDQFQKLAGVIRFWVCGGGMFAWYPEAQKTLKERGDIVWIYGGMPDVTKISTAITFNPMRTWMLGVDGYVSWLTTSSGPDPWLHFDGGSLGIIYPGDRFGIDGPLPTVRLKLQRNCVQDITLLDSFKSRKPLEELKAEAARRYNGTNPKDWWTPHPEVSKRPPYELNNTDIDEVTRPVEEKLSNVDAGAWQKVRQYVMQLAAEGK